jgi:hypothetical protein
MAKQIDITTAPGSKRPLTSTTFRIAAFGLVAALAMGAAAAPASARTYVYVDTPVYAYPPPVVYAPRPIYVAPAPAPIYVAPRPTCRHYQTSVAVGGATRQVTGTACLQPDGSWRVIR